MSKSERIRHLQVENANGWDPRYAGWFACFNRGLYFEAHDVLEDLWLSVRRGRDDLFYKGLIQLAGAFVHLQKNRMGPADALFRLARGHLAPFGPVHHGLDLQVVLELIDTWRAELASQPGNPLLRRAAPVLNPQPRSQAVAPAHAR